MTIKTYRKPLAGTILVTTWLLSGLRADASASPTVDLNSMTGQDLLSAQVTNDELPATSSDAIASIVYDSVTTGQPAASAGFSRPRSSMASAAPSQLMSLDKPVTKTVIAQDVATAPMITESVATGLIATDNVISEAIPTLAQSPNEDTFAPLTDEEIRQQLLIDPNFESFRPRPVPSSTFLIPSAYGADWRDAFIGVAGVTGGDVRNTVDGSASVGLGFGDAVDSVGVEVAVGIISLDGFAEDGTVGFKVHKVFPEANNLAIALGWSNPIKWGDANDDEDTFYGVATQQFDLRQNRANPMPITASIGVGTGDFRSTGAIAAGDNAPNVFGSVGWRVIPQVSLNTSWTGSGLGFAASAAPFDFPLVVTAGVSDVTDNTADGTRFHGSMGYSFSF